MRQIEKKMPAAIREGKSWQSDNTQVTQNNPCANVFLHGNHICEVVQLHDETMLIVNRATFRKWPTVTTVSRLRALGISASLKKGVAMIDGEPA